VKFRGLRAPRLREARLREARLRAPRLREARLREVLREVLRRAGGRGALRPTAPS